MYDIYPSNVKVELEFTIKSLVAYMYMSINLGDAALRANYLIKDGDTFVPESWLWGVLSAP